MSNAGLGKAKQNELAARMARLGIREEDLREQFIRGSGKGGQKINKTSSCVHLRHEPSGIVVKCQRERSRVLNRYLARRELCERLAERLALEQSRRQQEAERIRRQKRRRTRRQKQRILEEKRRQGRKKELRHPVRVEVE